MQVKHKGFTLIELMIVTAIIGILAALAIPQYQQYTAKAQAAEGFVIVGSLRRPVAEAIYNSGLSVTTCAMPIDHRVSGKYVAATSFNVSGASNCIVESTFAASGISELIANKKVTQTYSMLTGGWVCSTDLPSQIKPDSC